MKYILCLVVIFVTLLAFYHKPEDENKTKQPRYFMVGALVEHPDRTTFETGYFEMYDFRADSIKALVTRLNDSRDNTVNVLITGIFEFKSKKEMLSFKDY